MISQTRAFDWAVLETKGLPVSDHLQSIFPFTLSWSDAF